MFTSINSINSIKSKQIIPIIRGLTQQVIPFLDNDKFTSNNTTTAGKLSYIISASSVNGNNNPYFAFNGTLGSYWHCNFASSLPYDGSGNYVGIGTAYDTVVSSENVAGEWIQIKLSAAIILKSFSLRNRNQDTNRYPRIFTVGGSNDGNTWNKIVTTALTDNPDQNMRVNSSQKRF